MFQSRATMNTVPQFLTIKQAADRLGVAERTVHNYMQNDRPCEPCAMAVLAAARFVPRGRQWIAPASRSA